MARVDDDATSIDAHVLLVMYARNVVDRKTPK